MESAEKQRQGRASAAPGSRQSQHQNGARTSWKAGQAHTPGPACPTFEVNGKAACFVLHLLHRMQPAGQPYPWGVDARCEQVLAIRGQLEAVTSCWKLQILDQLDSPPVFIAL